ncbi:MAG: diacylglycerol/lipid kinase family protein [Phenylobacterium sp.]|uniref:diacylglycerol/lipid kinase family protein n=1 Tax=Phenylobacterium sp. TaxID=1871053 RepID=UPI00391B32DF
MTTKDTPASPAMTLRHVEVLVNLASGGVSPDAAERAKTLLAELGLTGRVQAPDPAGLGDALQRAVDAGPDVLMVLAGDGTARAAAELCGPRGPVLAPLPGGTMNLLPHAVYGDRPWAEAAAEALAQGSPRMIGGGQVDGRVFLVAAIIGAPALWAPAREAMRAGRPRLAIMRAQRALSRAFTGRLRYALDCGPRGKAEALALMCPLVSRAMENDADALEVAALDPTGAAEAFRIGLHAMLGDWRKDPAVRVERCTAVRTWAAGRIPALLDGESVRLERAALIEYRSEVVRVLAPPEPQA